MRRIIGFSVWLVACSLCVSVATEAQVKPKLTVAQGLSLIVALRNLDGHQVIIKQNDKDVVVIVPWDFGSGVLRLKIVNNINLLTPNEKAAEDARLAIIKEILKSSGVAAIQPDSPEMQAFAKQYGEVLTQEAQGVADLARIKASELKLDKNEIPVTAIAALMPVLDIDIPLK